VSFGSRRLNAAQMNPQPIASIFFGEGWASGAGQYLADWNAFRGRLDGSDRSGWQGG
jgi:hypothetical protein